MSPSHFLFIVVGIYFLCNIILNNAIRWYTLPLQEWGPKVYSPY